MPSDESPSVGAMLRAAREHQGLSINDIAERTRIRSTLIREIESDNFFGCGDPVYARGHIRSIAVTMGLDPGHVLDEYDGTHSLQDAAPVSPPVALRLVREQPAYEPAPVPPPPTYEPAPVPPPPTRAAPPLRTQPPTQPRTRSRSQRSSPPPRSRPGASQAAPARAQARPSTRAPRSSPSWKSALVAAASVVALLAVSSFLIGYAQGPRQPNASEPLPSYGPASPQPTPSTSVLPPAGVNVQVQANAGSTWVRVTDASGAQIFEGVMNTGDVKDFSDPKLLKIRFSNASSVTVLVNGVNKGTPTCGAVVCAETYQLA